MFYFTILTSLKKEVVMNGKSNNIEKLEKFFAWMIVIGLVLALIESIVAFMTH